MKRKVAIALAAVMVMAMPFSAYALTDEEEAGILEDFNEAAKGTNGEVFEVDDETGEVTESSGPVVIPRDKDGNLISDGAGGILTSGTKAVDDPATTDVDESQTIKAAIDAAEKADPDVLKPKYLKVTGGSVVNGSFDANYDKTETPAITVDPPRDPNKLLKSYAVVIEDQNNGNAVKWLVTGIKPNTDTADSIADNGFSLTQGDTLTGATTGVAFPTAGLDSGSYRIVVYALTIDNPFESGEAFTLDQFESAVDGHVLSQTRVTGLLSNSSNSNVVVND